jgi:hypothetical protein
MTIELKTPTFSYSLPTIERAERAIRCSPFQLKLFIVMSGGSVPVPLIAGVGGIEKGYTTHQISEVNADSELSWLMSVGLLRREVDGQGLTDSFRLTPLGRQVVEKWRQRGDNWPKPSWLDRIQNFCHRWLRLSFL